LQVALISDLHANVPALEAVLADIEQQKVDKVICLGDIATIGPQPRQIIDKLRNLDCCCIMGNHDAALLDPERTAEYQLAPVLIPSLQWCLRQMNPRDFELLQSFKTTIDIPLEAGTSLLCYHGSPDSITGTILSTTPARELHKYLTTATTKIMAGGHTHFQMLRQHMGTIFINPGSVGCPFLQQAVNETVPTLLPWAEYALVNLSDGVFHVDFRRVDFNIDLFCEILSESDLPVKNWWLQQYAVN
jgi:putative phosphoesterase